MDDLPFRYMPKPVVLEAVGFGHSTLAEKVLKGEFPPPDKIGSRSLWRSDLVARWLTEQAVKAEAEREERAKLARDKAYRMVQARVRKKAA
ncbi:MAG: helix-turn-helix transcriptional regulator [Burkholderiales bacterium]